MIYFPFKLRTSKTVSDGFQTRNESNPWRYFLSSKFEREPLPPVSSFAIDYWFIILIQEGTSRGAWTGIWWCNTRGSLRVKAKGVIPCRSLLFIEWFIDWILIHGNKSEIHVVQYNDYFAVIIALNSLKSTWLSPLTSAYKLNQNKGQQFWKCCLTSIIISCISSSVKCTPRFDITVLISLLQICLNTC